MFKKSEKFTLRFITKSWIYNIKRQIIFIDDESSVHYQYFKKYLKKV